MTPESQAVLKNNRHKFLSGGGETGKLIRSIDWSKTSIGNPEKWSQSLRTSVSICLNSHFPVLLWWGNDFVKIYNNAYYKIIGIRHPASMGAKGPDAWPEMWPVFSPVLQKVFQTGMAACLEDQLIILERNEYPEECYFTFSFSPILDDKESVGGVFCSITETMKRSPANRHLKNQPGDFESNQATDGSEERLRLAIEATGLGTWDFFPETGALNWSDRCKKIFGFPLDQEIDYSIYLDRIYPADKGTLVAAIQKAMDSSGPGTYTTEHRIIRSGDNAVRWVRGRGKVFFDKNLKPWRMIGTVLDITETKVKEDSLRENEERLRHAVDSGELGTYELDNETGDVLFSSRLANMLGLDSSKTLTRHDLKNAIHPDDLIIRSKAHLKARETGILFYEARVIWPDKSIHWVRFNGKVLYGDGGIALRTYGTAIDITEHKQVEQTLKQSEQELRLIADAIPHMVWVIDADGTISYINKQWADWTGLTLGEINNRPWEKIFHPADLFKLTDAWQHAIQNEEEYSGEYRIKDRSGNYFWFMGRTIPIKNSEGKIIKWIGTSTNIDTQKKIQDALKESEEQFRELADSMPQIVWTARPDGWLDYYNKKWYEFTGFEHGMNADAARSEILHPDDVEVCRQTWYESVRTGKPYHIEYRFKNRKKPGEYCWYLGRALPIYNSEGMIVKWYGTCTDINDQKEIETLLKESEKRFRRMADSVPQHVWTAKADGGLDYVNQRAINYFGKSAEEIIGEKKFESIHPEDVPVVLEKWTNCLKTNEPFQVEYRLKDKNNTYRWYLGRATPYFNKYNEVKWFGTNTDIQEKKYEEQKKDEFISIASHELKTPITSLKGVVFILKEILDEFKISKAVKLLDTMDNQLIKLTKLVTDLLDVNNIEDQQLKLDKADFEFSGLIKETVDSVQHMSPKHILVIESNEKLIYNGDKLRLEQVITNLLTNAVKYSPDGKKVIIRYEVSDENIVVSVVDFGIGIKRENIDKLFERFYRVNNSLRFGGLGLGLYISANIIKAHNGSFWIESEVDKGSSFYFLLPRNKNFISKTIHTDNKSFYTDGQVNINYIKENKWIEASWKGFQNMESVQRGCLVMLDLLKKNDCAKVLNDNTNILGNRAEAAKWGGNIWFPQMQNAGLQYFAWVYSPDAFSKLAAEKSVDIMTGSVTSRFFNNITDAEEWLKGTK